MKPYRTGQLRPSKQFEHNRDIGERGKKDSARDKFMALLNYHLDFVELYINAVEQPFFQFKNISDGLRPYIHGRIRIWSIFFRESSQKG